MPGHWVFYLERLPSLLAALVLLGLAAWLLWFDFETRLHRVFALLLVLKAGFLGLVAFGIAALDFAMILRMYFAIGIPFAALYFALVFRSQYAPDDRPKRPVTWPWAAVLALGAASFVLLFALRKDLYHDGTVGGPLGLFIPFAYAAFASIAIMFGWLATTLGPGNRRSALLLAALAFTLEAAYQVTYQVLSVPVNLVLGVTTAGFYLDRPVVLLDRLLWVGTAVLLVVLVARLRSAPVRADPGLRRDTRRFLLVLLLPVGTGLLALSAWTMDRTLDTRMFLDLHWGMDALWVVAGAASIVYAVVQHHFLDSRRQLRDTVRTSTLIGVLIVVFFVMKELLEEVLEEFYPVLPGLVAAAVAVILLQPLLLVVGRLARKWMPARTPLSDLKKDERLAVYRSQVEVVWMDGMVSRKERRLLDRMRERLDVPSQTAERIEREVMQQPADGESLPASDKRRTTASRPHD